MLESECKIHPRVALLGSDARLRFLTRLQRARRRPGCQAIDVFDDHEGDNDLPLELVFYAHDRDF